MDAVRSNDEDISGYVDLVYTHIFMVNLLRDKKGIIYRAEIDFIIFTSVIPKNPKVLEIGFERKYR